MGSSDGDSASWDDLEEALVVELFAWARKHGARGLEQIEVGHLEKAGQMVRGLVAATHLASPILVPCSLMLSADSEEELAARLAVERQRMREDEGAFWAPWIRILPSEEELARSHPNYAARDLLEAFAALPVVEKVQERLRRAGEAWDRCGRLWADAARAQGGGASSASSTNSSELTFEDFKWALTIVQSRVFLDDTGPSQMCSFMPFADMMNTGPEPNMEVYDQVECNIDLGEPHYGLVPLLDDEGCGVPEGAELIQSYRPVDNSERLFRGGFLIQDNPVPVAGLSPEACRALAAALERWPLEGRDGQPQEQLLTSLCALAAEHISRGGGG